jgi:hypothetical protein
MGLFHDALREHVSAPERRSFKTKIAGRDVELFASPLTGNDLDRLMLKHKNFATAPTVAASVDLFVSKCETEAGEKAFDITDKPFLMKMPLDWINALRAGLFPNEDVDLSDKAIDDEVGN